MLQQLQSAVAGEWLLSGGTVTCKILMPMTVRRSVEARAARRVSRHHDHVAACPGCCQPRPSRLSSLSRHMRRLQSLIYALDASFSPETGHRHARVLLA